MGQKEKIHIGLDFDDVIFDMADAFLAYQNERLRTSYTKEDLHRYEFEHIWNCSPRDIFEAFQDFCASEKHREASPIDGAPLAIQKILDQHDITVLTGREESSRPYLSSWLLRHIPELVDHVHFTSHFGENKKGDKGDMCKEMGIDIFVEDAPVHIPKLSEHVEEVFLFDMPWNRSLEQLPKNVERMHSWDDILQRLT